MTRDDVIRMAKEAGLHDKDISEDDCVVREYGDITDALWRFGELVAAAKREQCANLCDESAAALNALSIEYEKTDSCRLFSHRASQANSLATAIRALGD